MLLLLALSIGIVGMAVAEEGMHGEWVVVQQCSSRAYGQHEQAALALLLLCCSVAGGAIRFTLSLRATLDWTLWPGLRALAGRVGSLARLVH